MLVQHEAEASKNLESGNSNLGRHILFSWFGGIAQRSVTRAPSLGKWTSLGTCRPTSVRLQGKELSWVETSKQAT